MIHKLKQIIPFTTLIAVGLNLLLGLIGYEQLARYILLVGISLGAIPLAVEIVSEILHKRLGVDLLAILSITGSILLGEYLAGAIILLMISGGEYLEDFAIKRSRKELKNILSKAPRSANLIVHESLKVISVSEVKVGDHLLVKKGEIIPVDGKISKGFTELDLSTLTGESLPVDKTVGMQVLSGSVNLGEAIEIEAVKIAKHSKYQQIVELVKRAESQKAPYVRMADKYSVFFTILSLGLALIAYLVSNDPVRALTVLVVATPCPLILATPIAFTSGISQAARMGIVLKFGGAFEILNKAKSFVFDKTGTLTLGNLVITDIASYHTNYTKDQILQLCASLETLSEHIIARAITSYALKQKLNLTYPDNFKEKLGFGITGKVAGKLIVAGKPQFLLDQKIKIDPQINELFETDKKQGIMKILLAQDQKLIGAISLQDQPRKNINKLFKGLKRLRIQKILMLTGDNQQVAKQLVANYQIDDFEADCLPEDKLKHILLLKKQHLNPVVMVGDGVNDAPALANADIGIAMGQKGLNASTDAADAVVVSDDISKILPLMQLSHQVISVATQGILIGIGLSTILMILGIFGKFTPVVGAFAQEAIDFLVILNSLRVAKISKAG